MPEMTKYAPGMFCWTELSTSNAKEAKKFYKEVFGWGFDDRPIPDGSVYTMLEARGKQVAALYQQRPEEAARGVPPHWTLYIAVANADEVAARVPGLGGKVHAPPFDVMDVGRMAVIQDPTGAIFAIWQPGRHPGAQLVNELQSVCWNELTSTDPKKAEAFYTKLFGWNAKTDSSAGMVYTQFDLKGETVGGLMKTPMDGMPSYWTAYISVADCDATVKTAKSLGAQALVEPTDIPGVGRFGILQDPQGAILGVIKLLPR